MKPREIRKIQAACLALAEAALMVKVCVPVFATGAHPDWPMVNNDIQGLRNHLSELERLLPCTTPRSVEDLQWFLCRHRMPDFDITVLVSIEGEDDAHEAFRDEIDGVAVWRYSSFNLVRGNVYAWTDMPASLAARQSVRLALPAPAGGGR